VSKGDALAMKHVTHRDPSTGVEVTRLTGGSFDCHHPYFLYDPWVDDEKLIFYSNKDGTYHLYMLDIAAERYVQLTDGGLEQETYCGLVDRDLILTRGSSIIRLNMETLEEDTILDIGKGKIRGLRLSGDLSRMLFQELREGDRESFGCTVNIDGSDFVEHFRLKQNSCYLQFCPADNNLVTFAQPATGRPDASDEERARIWKTKLDDPHPEPFYIPPPGKKVTHEYWDSLGTRMFFQQYTYQTLLPTAICSVEKDGKSHFRKIVESDAINFCHSYISPDNRFIVADELSDIPNGIYLVDIEAGNFRKICDADTTWVDQTTHAHPRFDSAGRSVIFTSTRSGHSQIYRAAAV